jgi:hypothetical protein
MDASLRTRSRTSCARRVKVLASQSAIFLIVGDTPTQPRFPHGVDIYKVKRLLGHAKLVTTERYLNPL